MDYQVIIDGVFEVIKEKGFKKESYEGGEYFSNGEKAFMIDFDEQKSLISLKSAKLEEGEGVDWSVLSSWLMEQNATDADKSSIKNDFVESIMETLGAKASTSAVKKVEMPSKKKNADTIDIESFTARFLNMFPEFKDAYKQNVTAYGEFLYDTYFSEYGVKAMEKVLNDSNKRRTVKYFELLNTAYSHGEKSVATTIAFSIFGSDFVKDAKYEKHINAELEKHPHLYTAVRNVKSILS